MKHLKTFESFSNLELIREFTEFNLQRYGAASPDISTRDNSLSQDAHDRHENNIQAGIAKINTIMHALSSTGSIRALKSKLSLEDQDITHMNVIRINKSNNINYDAYIKFVIGEKEYWGVIDDILDTYPVFRSEVFDDCDLVQSKEWVIKTKGLIIKIIKKWLLAEEGKFKLLNDYINCYSVDTGRLQRIEKGSDIEVIRSFDNKIVIKYNNDFYNLVGDNYVYFNYWFEKID